MFETCLMSVPLLQIGVNDQSLVMRPCSAPPSPFFMSSKILAYSLITRGFKDIGGDVTHVKSHEILIYLHACKPTWQ